MKLVPTAFLLRYNRKAVMSPVAHRYTSTGINPIAPKLKHMYATRDPNSLWWKVSTAKPLQDYKRVVRSWCARRARKGFVQALKDRGYDALGRRISQNAEASEGGADLGPDLKGTAEIVILPEILKQDDSSIQKDMNILLDQIEQKAVDILPKHKRKSQPRQKQPKTSLK